MNVLLFALNGDVDGKARAVRLHPARRAVRIAHDADVQRDLERIHIQLRIRVCHIERRRHVLIEEERRGTLQIDS